MLTVKEVSKLTGISIRTLHWYDKIGLLKPTEVTDAGYRLYDEDALEKLQQILFYRELEFSLKDIRGMLNSGSFDRNKALEQQIELLKMKKEHLENLILFAEGIKLMGWRKMDFTVFDKKKLDEYAKRAKETWGETEAYREFEQKEQGRSKADQKAIADGLMELFAEFGGMMGMPPGSEEVQRQAKKLQDYITEHYYTCTKEILSGLGMMYAGGGEFTENIDKAAGKDCGEFVGRAVAIYCK